MAFFYNKQKLKGWTVKPEIFHEDKTDQSQKNICLLNYPAIKKSFVCHDLTIKMNYRERLE